MRDIFDRLDFTRDPSVYHPSFEFGPDGTLSRPVKVISGNTNDNAVFENAQIGDMFILDNNVYVLSEIMEERSANELPVTEYKLTLLHGVTVANTPSFTTPEKEYKIRCAHPPGEWLQKSFKAPEEPEEKPEEWVSLLED